MQPVCTAGRQPETGGGAGRGKMGDFARGGSAAGLAAAGDGGYRPPPTRHGKLS